jgi:hypothetical protein
MIAGIGGMLGGLPFGPGLIADYASEQLGRPLEIGLGPDVFGSDALDEDGQVVGSNTTHTGGSMTVHDSDDPNTFYGVSPGLGILGQGAANTAPRKATYTGSDPAPVDPAPADPYDPVTPASTPIDTPPNGGSFDPGNTNLSADELSRIFLGFMTPGRTSRGRNAGRVVI